MAKNDKIEEARLRHAEAHHRLDAGYAAGYTDEAWPAWQASATEYWIARHPEDRRLRRDDTNRTPTVEEMRELAGRIESATQGVPETWNVDGSLRTEARDEFATQVGWWHELMRALYDPIDRALEKARRGDESGVETLIRFLEADVYCHRSGYFKAYAIRAITRLDLDLRMHARLADVVVRVVDGPDRREFRNYIRLARYLDSPALRESLLLQHASSDPRTARHARWILDGMKAGGPRPPMIGP